MKRIELELPFEGFYESIHDDAIDSTIDNYCHDDDGNEIDGAYDRIYESDIDWDKIRRDYCRQYIELVNGETGLHFEYLDMTSPREYNFTTDRLFCTLPTQETARIRREVEQYGDYASEIKERFTSRDGFWSNYSADIKHDDWQGELDECQWAVLLELYFKHNQFDFTYLPYDVDITNLDGFDDIFKALNSKEVAK